MNSRLTLLLVAIFALLIGYLYFIELKKTPEQLGTPVPTVAPQVFNLNATNIQSVELRDLHSVRQVKVNRTAGGWQVEQPESKPADSARIDAMVSQLATLQTSRVLTDVSNLGQFGLISATLEVRLVMSDTTPYALTVGNKTTDGMNYYAVYTGDKSKVFIIPASSIDDMRSWLDTPPYQPTPTPTATATPPVTPTAEGTPAATPPAPATAAPTP